MPALLASLTIPAYREGARLPALLRQLAREALGEQAPPVEIVVVDDGSEPGEAEREQAATLELAAQLEATGSPHRARFVASPRNGGKGAAIRLGWAEADGGAAWLGFLDADGAVSAREAWRLVRAAESADGVDVLAATRILMADRHIERSLFRHLQGRVFATLAEQMFHLGFYDTQCGLKLFRAQALRPLLPSLREDRWLLDLEVLALLHRAGARFREVPVDWSDPGGSKMVPGLDAVRMAAGMWCLRRRLDARGPSAPPLSRGAEPSHSLSSPGAFGRQADVRKQRREDAAAPDRHAM
jgi:glycosyltransferase involved in cell wall biosynthesis